MEAGNGTGKMQVPLYLYHGQTDEFIPLDQNYDLKTSTAVWGKVTFDLYPSEHHRDAVSGLPYVLNWMDERFSGLPAS